ncbi:MAG: enoyl-CoA hydratase/isomerase family protein [Planctomycetota bacterium]|nr:enoyl-CoA hydratase/isomerase family protein [Planctomycetota bacterium]
MKKNLSLTSIEPFIRVEIREGVAVFRLTDDVIDMALDLKVMVKFWDIFEAFEKSSEVTAMLFLGSKSCFSPERADAFLEKLKRRYGSESLTEGQKQGITLEENAMWRFIRKVRGCSKLVLTALQGDVTTAFLGTSLAYDLRIVSEDTVFHIRCHEIGLPPIGGLAYFLPLYVGWGRANRILLEMTKIDAKQAFDLGLVDDVVTTDDLAEISLTRARELAHKPAESVRAIKSLLNMHLSHLEATFDTESKIITTALNKFKLRKPE